MDGEIKHFLKTLVEKDGSDLFLKTHSPVYARINGEVVVLSDKVLSREDIDNIVSDITTPTQRQTLKEKLDMDFALYFKEVEQRFRVSIFCQMGNHSLVIRQIRKNIQSFEELNLPVEVLKKLSLENRGLVLLTGAAGSGKSTTIAAMIDYINENTPKHILTVEEPVEFTFKDKKSVINQRELGLDVSGYKEALRAFTLQSPDVIYIANIRDVETMSAALTAAETGVLVLSTLHTINSTQTIERIINFFPPYQHEQIRIQLSFLLKGVIALRLIPRKDGQGRIPSYETMLLTPTIARLIRENKIWEIPRFISEGQIFGMQTFAQSLANLIKEKKIEEKTAIEFCDNKEEFNLVLKGFKKA